ncbi:MAG: TetR/AcrR family transcriptional regulator [Thermodesulfobacteriota bacterium]
MNRRQASKTETRRLILDAARGLLRKKSVDQCTMRAIAEKAGVSPASVIVHFKNKISLLEATIFEDIDHTVKRAMVKLPDKADLATRLTFIPGEMFVFYAKNRDLYRALLSSTLLTSGENSPNLNQQMDEYLTFISGMIEQDKHTGTIRPDADAQFAAMSIVAMYFGVLIGFFKEDRISPKLALDILKKMTGQYLVGIMTDPRESSY